MARTYATLCVDYRGNDVVELISSLVCLQRVDPGATVHVMANAECRAMLERSPVRFDTLNVVYDDSIDEYLKLTDEEINAKGLVAEYYAIFFEFLKGACTAAGCLGGGGVTYFSVGCWFLRAPPWPSLEDADAFVGVEGTNNGDAADADAVKTAFSGDMFWVRDAAFVEAWRARVLREADEQYERNIEDVVVQKRDEYMKKETERRAKERREPKKAEAQEEAEADQPEALAQDAPPEEAEVEVPEEAEVEVPDDFDDEMRRSYRLYMTVHLLKSKFAYVHDVVNANAAPSPSPDVESPASCYPTSYYNAATYVNPALFYRMRGSLEFDELKKCDETGRVCYKGEPVCVLKKLTGNQGNDALNAPVHKIVSLFMNDHPANGNLLTLASGHKIAMNRAFDGDFCGYAHEPCFDAELFELMEAKNRAFVANKWLLYPCNSIGGVVQVYPGDDERHVLLPYLSGSAHTFYHFELSEATKATYAKYNPDGWSKHLQRAERPLTLHRVLHAGGTGGAPLAAEADAGAEAEAEAEAEAGAEAEDTEKKKTEVIYDPMHCLRFGKPPPPPPPLPSGEEEERQGRAEPNEEDEGTKDEDVESGLVKDPYEVHVRAMLGARFTHVYAPHQLAEALACGSVPLVYSDDVDTRNYEDPLIEGTHYLYLEAETADVDGVIERLGVGAEAALREAGRAYYARNCSPDGFFQKLMARYFGLGPPSPHTVP